MSDALLKSNEELEIEKQLHEANEADLKFPGPKDFTHLHTHSLFSTLDGVATPEQYIERCAQVGMKNFALTDHGSLAGVPDAYWAAKEHKINFSVGCEIYLNEQHLKIKELQNQNVKLKDIKTLNPELVEGFRRNRHLTVICKNMVGYKNLLNLMHDANELGLYYGKPRTWFSQLEKYREGLIIISGCLNGPICHELRRASKFRDESDDGNTSKRFSYAIALAKKYRDTFGDDFYLELQMPGESIEGAKEVFFQLSEMSKKLNIKAVMTGDIHYLHRRDFELQKVMMAVEQGMLANDPNLFHVDSDEGFFKTRAQFRQTFFEHGYDKYDSVEWFEKACDNTMDVVGKCKQFEPDLSPKLPEIQNADEIIQQFVAEALIKRGLHKDTKKYPVDGRMVTYTEQVKIELARIVEKKFSSYFLITRNLVNYAHENDFDVGPARGSSGGSLVLYLLGVHSLDPLKWGLSFDRFLSPARGGFMLNVKMDDNK